MKLSPTVLLRSIRAKRVNIRGPNKSRMTRLLRNACAFRAHTRSQNKRRVVLLLLLILLLAPAPARATAQTPVVRARVRIGVTADGITQITPADLLAAGVVADVDPRTFALSSQGQPVAILVEGETDGVFSGADRLLFFGQKFRGPEMEQKYTDENVYWLEIGGAAGPRITSVDATPQGNLTPPADFPTTLRAEENREWWTLHTLTLDTQDTWFWARLRPPIDVGSAATVTLPYTIPYPASAASATFRLEEISRAYAGPNPDHRTTATVNGLKVIDETWSDKQRRVFTAALPAGLLTHGLNTVRVVAWTMPGNVRDDVYANYWEVDYRRLFRAWQGRLDFTAELAGPQEYESDGWASAAVAIWDISAPDAPRVLTGASVTPAGAASSVRFRAAGAAGARYWLQEDATFAGPASLRPRPIAGLPAPAGGADAVIVTSAALRPAADQLAEWHRTNGRRAVVMELQDVYDEFNHGILHPKAVPALLNWAATRWPAPAPAYLTLLGDGDWNLKGYNPTQYPPGPNHVPPYLAWVDPWQGEVPADALYGDLDGDAVPDIAVGRLAVNTLAEANTVVDKIVAYDQTMRRADWQRRALFVADNPDSAGDFPAVSDAIIADYTPADLEIVRAYLPGTPDSVPPVPATVEEIAATRAIISDTLQSGVWLVQFTGHGAPERWTHESIWRNTYVNGLTNGKKLPVVMTFNCLDGYFAHTDPTLNSIAEVMQRHAGGGAIAAISPSGLGLTDDQQIFRTILMDVLFKADVRELGRALTEAKRRYYQRYGANYLIDTMTLFGDPALRLPGSVKNTTYLPLLSK